MKLNSHHPLHNLSDAELIPLCLQQQRCAWEEFFKRFSPVIRKAIRWTFIKRKARDLAEVKAGKIPLEQGRGFAVVAERSHQQTYVVKYSLFCSFCSEAC
jgi:hypothetical protein